MFGLAGALLAAPCSRGLFEAFGGRAAARAARGAGPRGVDGLLGARADRAASGSAWSGSSARWRCRTARTGSATRSSAPRSCAAQHDPAALGPLLNALRRSTRSRGSTGRRRDVAPPTARDRARSRRRSAAAGSVVKVLGTACGLGRGGLGLGGGRRARRDERARRGRASDDTRVLLRGREPGPGRDRGRTSTRATTSRSCAWTGSRRPSCPRADVRSGRRPPSSASRSTGPIGWCRARVGTTRKVLTSDAYGHGPVRALDHRAARIRTLRQLRRADGRRGRARRRRRCSPRRRAGRAAATASRTTSCAARCGTRAARSRPGPCAG